MQYLLIFINPVTQQSGSVRYADGVVPPIPANGQVAEFVIDATGVITAQTVTGVSYNYQDTTGAQVVVTITVGP
jgi:hypothetical protein